MSVAERVRRVESRLYAAARHPAAADVAVAPASGATIEEALDGADYCLVVSYRRNGQPVATPVWFALAGDRLVFESDADSLKVRRIRRDGRVRVAPCSSRGRPLAAPADGLARLLEPAEEAAAERALHEKYGRMRSAISRARPTPEAGRTYVEVRRRPRIT